MNWHLSSSIQLVISDLNEIAADAYRHRIRPTSKKGGSGAYDGSNGGRPYSLPAKYLSNRRAQFAITLISADSIEIQALSPEDKSVFVKAVIDRRGRLHDISYPDTPVNEQLALVRISEVALPFRVIPKLYSDEA